MLPADVGHVTGCGQKTTLQVEECNSYLIIDRYMDHGWFHPGELATVVV